MRKICPLVIIVIMTNTNCSKKDDGGTNSNMQCTIDNTVSTDLIVCSESLSESIVLNTSVSGNNRIFETNHIPDHLVGKFPNQFNPNKISPIQETLTMSLYPQKQSVKTNLQGSNGPAYAFGIALNGIVFDPVAAEPWGKGTSNVNWEWNLEASNNQLGLDCNRAHVQPNGEYHYHGKPELYLQNMAIDGKSMVMVGWAADGFPIYYKYAYEIASDAKSSIIEMKSSYKLKSGNRPGDGISAPCDTYNGKYVNDYEYDVSIGHLDECNGREGVTPEFQAGTYYYVITDEFPSIPRCLYGSPADDFRIGP